MQVLALGVELAMLGALGILAVLVTIMVCGMNRHRQLPSPDIDPFRGNGTAPGPTTYPDRSETDGGAV